MESINNTMAAITIDANNEVVVYDEMTSDRVISQCTQSSLQFTPDLSHGSAQGVDTAPGENITQDALQTHNDISSMTQGTLRNTARIRPDMRAKIEECHAELKLLLDPHECSRAKERVFVIFSSLPKELQLKIWKEAAIRKGTNLDIVTEVFYRPGTEARPNPRFIPNKQPSPLLHTCQDSREVALKEFYTLALQYENKGLRAPYAPVYSHCNDIIYLQINDAEDRSITVQEMQKPQHIILNALNQGVTNLAIKLDFWSCHALVRQIHNLKKLKRLFLVVAVPHRIHRGRRLCMYAVDNSEPRRISVAESQMLPTLKQIFAKLKKEDPKWVPPIVELVGMRTL
ncbi:hypothetical protein OCU04_007447 [Sclerotinia nivalis]|uniref:2EXR domain-containing protein n=1 Tax=Sclerotinia nivalis TaxID=352851 RepID=A0A9X0AJU7_9HELO|nr:hypothetical protein OCU04_007447 [Sclerotinia nivalis]